MLPTTTNPLTHPGNDQSDDEFRTVTEPVPRKRRLAPGEKQDFPHLQPRNDQKMETIKERAKRTHHRVQQSIQEKIKSTVNASGATAAGGNGVLISRSIISNTQDPFVHPIVRQLLLAPVDQVVSPLDCTHPTIEVISRAWEEKFLRAPEMHEKKCCHGNDCQGKIKFGFELVEYYTPLQFAKLQESVVYPINNVECLICLRHSIARAVIESKSTNRSVHPNIHVSIYCNRVGVPGEYCLEDCLISSVNSYNGLMDPVVVNNYNKMKAHGKVIKQLYATPTSENTLFFRPAPRVQQN